MKKAPLALTTKQQRVLNYVLRYLGKHGIPPTRREIADYFGFASLTAAQGHLKAIENKGYIRLTAAISRGIQINGR